MQGASRLWANPVQSCREGIPEDYFFLGGRFSFILWFELLGLAICSQDTERSRNQSSRFAHSGLLDPYVMFAEFLITSRALNRAEEQLTPIKQIQLYE